MNILLWTDGFWPRLGGIETHGFQLIQQLQKRGHRCTVIAQKDHPSWKEEEIYEGIFIRRFDFNAILSKKELKTMGLIQAYLSSIIEEFCPDIIHLNACLGGSAFVFDLFKALFRVPIIMTAHSPYPHAGKIPPVVESIAKFATHICCVSKFVCEEMERYLPQLKDKLKLVYNGLPWPTETPSELPFSPSTLLLFGRLAPEKGFDTAITAFSLLKRGGSDAHLIIAGQGSERLNLEKQVGELGLTDSVTFTGALSPAEVAPTFNRATLVIVPSLIESFGLVILEAMQMGRPVIASRVEGIPEVVDHGKTGLLVPPKHPIALCEAIQTLLSEPEKAIAMGIEGRKRARLFPIEQNADQFEQIYRKL